MKPFVAPSRCRLRTGLLLALAALLLVFPVEFAQEREVAGEEAGAPPQPQTQPESGQEAQTRPKMQMVRLAAPAGSKHHLFIYLVDGLAARRIPAFGYDRMTVPNLSGIMERGITYTGTTSPKTTDVAGLFCADVMRSEPAGEDIDGDGVTGETHQVEILVYSGGNYYRFGPYSLPETAATCDSGGCYDVGDLVLSEANRIEVSICTFQGKVVYSGVAYRGTCPLSAGDPVPNAFVWGYDEEAWNDQAATDCFVAGTCTLYDLSDALGDYSLTAPILTGLDLEAWLAATSADPHEVAYYMGAVPVRGCPVGTVTLPVDYWSIWVLTADMQDAGGDVDGSFVVIDTVANCFFTAGSNFYLAVSSSVPAAPVPPADWFTMDLTRISSTGSITPRGTLTVRIEDESAEGYLRGTWTAPTAGLSGTWQEYEYPAALRTPGLRGKEFVKEALKRVTSAPPR